MCAPRRVTILLSLTAAVALPLAGRAQEEPRLSIGTASTRHDGNSAVLDAVEAMPKYGTYSASKAAFAGLERAISVAGHGWEVNAEAAEPSFCSGATYLVFVRALSQLTAGLDRDTLSALLVSAGQRDGQGIWGRWNANGPGTARLFTELHLGHNFTDFEAARPGDFAKFFWSEEIGQREHGHSVVYLGRQTVGNEELVRFWSSNMPTQRGDLSGYSDKVIPRSRIVRAIFSRLEEPANIIGARALGTDAFLAGLLLHRATMDEVRAKCGM